MNAGDTRRSMLLAPQGKIEFLLWVLAEDERIGLMTDPGRGEALASALSRYRIRVDVEVNVETKPCWLVVGEWSGYDVSWSTTPRRLVVGDRPDLPDGERGHYESLRIKAGEPAWGLDVGEGAIPQESGLVGLTVDFDKGCFLGQELVARIDSRGGQAPRRLMAVESDHDLTPDAVIVIGDEEVGLVTSAVGGNGLAMVKRGTQSNTPVNAGDVEAIVRDLPNKSHG